MNSTDKSTEEARPPACYVKFSARTILLHLFTGKDGISLDLGRVMWVVTAFAHIAYTAWQAAVLKVFDPTAFATGAGLIAGGFGANILMKAQTEPDAK